MENNNRLNIKNGQYEEYNKDANEFEFHDISEEFFSVHGLYKHVTGEDFLRMPDDVAEKTSKDVHGLNKFPAGGRIRFATDSDAVYVRMYQGPRYTLSHVCPILACGCDVYVRDNDGKQTFKGIVFPAWDKYDIVSGKVVIGAFKTEKEVVVNLPHHAEVTKVEIGVRIGSKLSLPTEYRHSKPIVYYGSSITHGFCASRPGTTYEAIISRKYDTDYINLGFSGSARGEQSVADYISTLDMSAFVLDYDYNAPNHEFLNETHYNFYETVRKANPNLPIILVSKPDFYMDYTSNMRRAVIMKTFSTARFNGDNNIYYVDGASFFTEDYVGDYTVDTVHPTDRGFGQMAKNIGLNLARILNFKELL